MKISVIYTHMCTHMYTHIHPSPHPPTTFTVEMTEYLGFTSKYVGAGQGWVEV